MQNLVIETKRVSDGVYQAALAYGEPELGVGGAINVSARDYTSQKAANTLVELIRALGYKGSFRVEGVILEIEALDGPDTNTADYFSDDDYVPSDSGSEEYHVEYDECDDPLYTCTCADFKYRRQQKDEACKHIARAISYYDLGKGREEAEEYANKRGIWVNW